MSDGLYGYKPDDDGNLVPMEIPLSVRAMYETMPGRQQGLMSAISLLATLRLRGDREDELALMTILRLLGVGWDELKAAEACHNSIVDELERSNNE